MRKFNVQLVPLILFLTGCTDPKESKLQLKLPEAGKWYTVENDHPVIVEALRGIEREEKNVIRARVKGEMNFIYYEVYSHTPGYAIWRDEIARERFQLENGTLMAAGPEVRYQLIGQNTVQPADVPQ